MQEGRPNSGASDTERENINKVGTIFNSGYDLHNFHVKKTYSNNMDDYSQ